METSRKIAIQSSMKTVIDWATLNDEKLSLQELVSITDFLADYIEGGYNEHVKEGLKSIDRYLLERRNTK